MQIESSRQGLTAQETERLNRISAGQDWPAAPSCRLQLEADETGRPARSPSLDPPPTLLAHPDPALGVGQPIEQQAVLLKRSGMEQKPTHRSHPVAREALHESMAPLADGFVRNQDADPKAGSVPVEGRQRRVRANPPAPSGGPPRAHLRCCSPCKGPPPFTADCAWHMDPWRSRRDTIDSCRASLAITASLGQLIAERCYRTLIIGPVVGYLHP